MTSFSEELWALDEEARAIERLRDRAELEKWQRQPLVLLGSGYLPTTFQPAYLTGSSWWALP